MVRSIIIVGLGGFIGTVLRYLISRYFQMNSLSLFPWGTFVVNIVGCLLIGIIYGITERGDVLDGEMRLFLAVGLCGGFTTFSSFSNEAFMLLQGREFMRFALYSGMSFIMGLFSVFLGRFIIKVL